MQKEKKMAYGINPAKKLSITQQAQNDITRSNPLYGSTGTEGLAFDGQQTSITDGRGWTDYGDIYKNRDGNLMTSSLGSDSATNMQDFNKWAEVNPDLAAQAGADGLAFNETGQQAGLADSGNTDLSMDGMGGLALGAGNLAMGVASFLESKKTAGVQRDLLKENLADVRGERKHRTDARAALNEAFTS